MKFIINKRDLSKEKRPFILAEVACAHDGDFNKVVTMIEGAAKSGADGIQFQMFSTTKLLVPDHSFFKIVNDLEISFDEWEKLIHLAQDKGLLVFANILEGSALEVALKCGVDALKIHSSDLSNPSMLNNIMDSKLPVLLSVGGSSVEEIHQAVALMKKGGVDNLMLMHGFQAFPTRLEDSHLNYIETLKKMYNLPVGYQDHVDAESEMAMIVPLLAINKGILLLEKHITDSRQRKGTDYQSALNPDEFNRFVSLINESSKVFGEEKIRNFSDAEMKYRENFKKSIVAARDIQKGETLCEEMFYYMRGEPGFSPKEKERLLNKKCVKSLKRYESFRPSHIEGSEL